MSHELLSTDLWIVISNLMLVSITMLSIREEHKTIRQISKANNKLLNRILSLITGKAAGQGKHKGGQ